jgi:hypothetical protein
MRREADREQCKKNCVPDLDHRVHLEPEIVCQYVYQNRTSAYTLNIECVYTCALVCACVQNASELYQRMNLQPGVHVYIRIDLYMYGSMCV